MKWVTLIMTTLLVSNVTFAMGGKEKNNLKRAEVLQKSLNLTDEQMTKILELRKNKKGDFKEERKKFQEEKMTFKTVMKDPNISNEELSKKFESFHALRNEYQKKKFSMMLAMREILTPEQRIKFYEMRKEGKGKRGNRRGNKDQE